MAQFIYYSLLMIISYILNKSPFWKNNSSKKRAGKIFLFVILFYLFFIIYSYIRFPILLNYKYILGALFATDVIYVLKISRNKNINKKGINKPIENNNYKVEIKNKLINGIESSDIPEY